MPQNGLTSPKVYDIIIVGAGPGGSSAAHYLAQAGLDVLLLDKFDFPRDKTCGDGLTPLAVQHLQEIGILAAMGQAGCQLRRLEIVAPNGYTAGAQLPPHPTRPDYTLVVPRLILDNALRERAVASGAIFQSRIHVTHIEEGEREVVVKGGHHGQTVALRGRLAIIATGASVKLLLNMGILSQPPAMMLAARTYYEEIPNLTDQIQFHFDGVPLPGYGWVFPLGEGAANIGAGIFHRGRRGRQLPTNPAKAFERFLQLPELQALLAQARQVGPVKGYPLRIDFATAPTHGKRVLLVGEAAGLVNPLTGEGIDYALESGQIAAQFLIDRFASGDLSAPNLAAYDHLLRRRFQSLFRFCHRMQGFLPYPALLNRLVKAADVQPELKMMLVNIVLGNLDVAQVLSGKVILRALYAMATA